MKNYLLAGCAAVALTGFCGTAMADSAPGKFDIKLGGDAYFTYGYVDQNTDSALGNTRHSDFTNRFRLQVTPTAKADNGIEYGANLRIRAWMGNGLVDTDQAYIFVGGNFGRVEAGVNQGPNSQYGITAPNGFGTGGVVGDWAEGTTGWLSNQNTFLEPVFGGGFDNVTNTNFATRINYFTPRFFGQESTSPDDAPTGLMGMLSYAPQNISVQTGVNRNPTIVPGVPTGTNGANGCTGNLPLQGCFYSDVVEAGLRYDGTFQNVSVSASLGYEHGAGPTVTTAPRTYYNDLSAYQAGLQLGYAGFTVGGSYLNAGKSGYDKAGTNLSDQSTWTAGISYQTGPVVVGFNYARGEDAGDIFVPGKRTADLYSVGALYTVAPGLTTALEYLHSSTKNETGFVADSFGNGSALSGDANLFLFKTMVTF